MADPVISANKPRAVSYSAAAAQTDFGIPYAYFLDEDNYIEVWREDEDGELQLVGAYQGGDGDMSCDPPENGVLVGDNAGTAIIPPCEEDDLVVLHAATALDREAAYTSSGRFPASTVNREFNRRVAVDIEQQEQLDRAPVLPAGMNGGVLGRPPAAGAVLGFVDDVWDWVTGVSTAIVSSFMANALLASTAHGFAKVVSGSLTLQTYAELKALTSPANNVTYKVRGRNLISDGGGHENIRWTGDVDVSNEVDADPGQGVIIQANFDPTGEHGAFTKVFNGTQRGVFTAETFGVFSAAVDDESKAAANTIGIHSLKSWAALIYESRTLMRFGVGDYCFDPLANFTGLFSIEGLGPTITCLWPSAEHGEDDDNITFKPTTGLRGLVLRGFTVGSRAVGSRNGRHGLVFDFTAAGGSIGNLFAENVNITGGGEGQRALKVVCDPDVNINGGGFTWLWQRCSFGGGILVQHIGDSNALAHCQFVGGEEYNIDYTGISTVTGGYSSQHNITDINSIESGAARIRGGSYVNFDGGNVEQFTPAGNDYLYWFEGAANRLRKPSLRNQFLAVGVGLNLPATLRVGASEGFEVDGCNFLCADGGATSSAADIIIDNTATDAYIGARNSFNRIGGPIIQDDGQATRGLKKALSLLNGHVAFGAETPWIKKSYEGDLIVHAVIKSGTVTNTTPIFTSATGLRPAADTRVKVVVDNAGTRSVEWAKWKSNGDFIVDGTWPGNTCIEIDVYIEASGGGAMVYA